MNIVTRLSAADAVAINALGALLLMGGLHRDIDAELRAILGEMLPQLTRENPDMTALRRAAEDLLHGTTPDDRAAARRALAWQVANILRVRAFEALARLQESEGRDGQG